MLSGSDTTDEYASTEKYPDPALPRVSPKKRSPVKNVTQVISIDPLHIKETDNKLLCNILDHAFEQHDTVYFSKGIDSLGLSIELTHPILRRPCEENPGDYRYEILYPLRFKGCRNLLYIVLGTLVPQKNGSLILKNYHVLQPDNTLLLENARRIVKEMTAPSRIHDFAQNVYQLGREADHHYKPPSFVEEHAYLVMGYYPRKNLAVVLKEAGKTWDADTRLQAWISFLHDLDHLHELGIVHRDIKPANILYDAVTKKLKIIDLDISRLKNNKPKISASCSPQYAAPEVTKGINSGFSSDDYSAGLIGRELFGAKRPHYGKPGVGLFTNIHDLTQEEKIELSDLFDALNVREWRKRGLLSDAIHISEGIAWKRRLAGIHVDLHPQLNHARAFALDVRKMLWNIQNFAMTKEILSITLGKIDSSPLTIAIFLETLRIPALMGLNTKEEIEDKLADILLKFKQSVSAHDELAQKLMRLGKERDCKQACDEIIQSTLYRAKHRYAQLRNQLSLDNIIVLTRKYAKENQRAEGQLTALRKKVTICSPYKHLTKHTIYAPPPESKKRKKPENATKKVIKLPSESLKSRRVVG